MNSLVEMNVFGDKLIDLDALMSININLLIGYILSRSRKVGSLKAYLMTSLHRKISLKSGQIRCHTVIVYYQF